MKDKDTRSGCSMPPIYWLARELLAEYSRTGDVSLAHEFLGSLSGFERKDLQKILFWHGIGNADWPLAQFCIRAGYPITPDEDDLSDWGPLHQSMQEFGNRPDIVEWMLKNGAQIDRRGPGNATPLMIAASEGFAEIVSLLLAKGADINASTQFEFDLTALIAVAMKGHKPIVEILLKNGADRLRRDAWGGNAADWAQSKGNDALAESIRRRK